MARTDRRHHTRRHHTRRAAALAATFALVTAGLVGAATAVDPVVTPPPITANATWLETVNYYRAMAGLAPVTEDPALSAGDALHARYVAETGQLTHTEDPSSPFSTPEGAAAGLNSNVANSSGPLRARTWIELWIGGPFHALGILDPKLTSSGFGSYDKTTAPVASAAALDIITGLDGPAAVAPVMWPADGTTVPLDRFPGGESPDPLTSCPGHTAPAGLPILLQLPVAEALTSASVTRGAAAVAACAFDGNTYTNPDAAAQTLGRSILTARNAVVVVPKSPLAPNAGYDVAVTTSATTYSWSFRTAIPPPCLNPANQSVVVNGLRFEGFGRGLDKTLCHRINTGSSWGDWTSRGGAIAGRAVPVSWGPRHIDVFARGVDSALWKLTYNGKWNAWRNMGGAVRGTPAVASWASGRLDVFVRGTDDAVWHRSFSGQWSRWTFLGGAVVSNPGAKACGVGCVRVGGTGTDGLYWKRIFKNGGWDPWTPT